MKRPGLLFRLPEPELLGPAVRLQRAPGEGDEAGGAGGDDAELAEVRETAIDGGRPLGDDALCALRADAGYAEQLLVGSSTYFDRESLGVRQRPRRLRIGVEREIPALVIDELLRAEAVVAEEVVSLVKPVLAERGCGRMGFERSLADRAERAELAVVHAAACVHVGHPIDDRAIVVVGRADDELHRHPADSTGVERVARPPGPFFQASAIDDAARALEGIECCCHVLLGRDLRERLAARRLEIHRNARGERGEAGNLFGIRARHDLHVDVPGEAMTLADHLRSEEHTSELQSLAYLVCRLLLEKKKKTKKIKKKQDI